MLFSALWKGTFSCFKVVMIILSWWFLIRVSTKYSSIDKGLHKGPLYIHIIYAAYIYCLWNYFFLSLIVWDNILQSDLRSMQLVLILSLGWKSINKQGNTSARENQCALQVTWIRLYATKFTNTEFLNDRIIFNFIWQIEMTLRWPQMTFIIYF